MKLVLTKVLLVQDVPTALRAVMETPREEVFMPFSAVYNVDITHPNAFNLSLAEIEKLALAELMADKSAF